MIRSKVYTLFLHFTHFLIIASWLSACSSIDSPSSTIVPTAEQTPTSQLAMVTFRVSLLASLSVGESIVLTVLDEISGLAFNQQSFPMEAEDSQHFIVILPFPLNSVVKYRYEREGEYSALEHNSDGRAVRYRIYYVTGPGIVQDTVSRWTDTPFTWSAGRITGLAVEDQTDRPIPDLLVCAGGMQTMTAADGSFWLEGLPPGVHNLVIYAKDGSYMPFQQGAVVAPGSETPAEARLSLAPLVNMVFVASVPPSTPPEAQLRFAGNLSQLGNTFADLEGGISAIAARMPMMAKLPDGRFSITLTLPVGADLRYRYTLGDGLWNAERTDAGKFLERQLIVPAQNGLIEEQVAAWESNQAAPLKFDVSVPDSTPRGETIFIQFNPSYGWTEPVPMWPVSENRWSFTLFNPLDGLSSLQYRYCRNAQCGSANEASAADQQNTKRMVQVQTANQTLTDRVEAWAWTSPTAAAVTVPSVAIPTRGESFIAGIAFEPGYHPSWEPLMEQAIQRVQRLNANWLALSPGWNYTRQTPPILEGVNGRDIPWPALAAQILYARNLKLQVALYPLPRFPTDAAQWWQSAPRDFSWWISWFGSYRRFILNFVDQAAQHSAEGLILGGDWLAPALPGGSILDSTPPPGGIASNIPLGAENYWRQLIAEVRQRYPGQLFWALSFPEGIENPPAFLDAVDMIYLLMPAMSGQPGATEEQLTAQVADLLDNTVLPFQQKVNLPIILAASYSSAAGLQEQANAYNALFLAANERDWVSGIVSQGFYPPLGLQNPSSSINGKLAEGVLWFWFGGLLGK